METIGFLDPVRSAPAISWGTRHIGSALNREASQADSDFSATLLAIAGHDLRQPLQVITSAHGVLAQSSPVAGRKKVFPDRGQGLTTNSRPGDERATWEQQLSGG